MTPTFKEFKNWSIKIEKLRKVETMSKTEIKMTVSSSDYKLLTALLMYLTGEIDRDGLEKFMTGFMAWELGDRHHQPDLRTKDELLADIARNLQPLVHTAA